MNETVEIEDGRMEQNRWGAFDSYIKNKSIPHDERINKYNSIKSFYITLIPEFFETYDDFERALHLLKLYNVISDDFKDLKPHSNKTTYFNKI